MADRKRSYSSNSQKAKGFINIAFIPKSRLADDTLTVENILEGPKLAMSRGAPIYGSKIDDKILEKVVDAAYDKVEEYLDKDVSNSVNDPECPKLEALMEVSIRVYSEERHVELFGSEDDLDDEEY